MALCNAAPVEGDRAIECPCGGWDCPHCSTDGKIRGTCDRCGEEVETDTVLVTDRGDVLCSPCYSGYLDVLRQSSEAVRRYLLNE
jgi:hypothetical protein